MTPEPKAETVLGRGGARRKWADYLALKGISLNSMQEAAADDVVAAIDGSKNTVFWEGSGVGKTFLLEHIDRCFGGQ